jgi:hypothetical protein
MKSNEVEISTTRTEQEKSGNDASMLSHWPRCSTKPHTFDPSARKASMTAGSITPGQMKHAGVGVRTKSQATTCVHRRRKEHVGENNRRDA